MTTTAQSKAPFSISGFLTGDRSAGFLLSLVAGFVDTAAFVILFGIFTAHVTGNIALAGSSFVSDDEESTLTRLLMLPVFMVTVALTSVLARYARKKQWPVFAVLLTAEAVALGIFLVVGATLSPALLLDVQEEYILPIGMSGVVAMAIQNTLMKESHGVFKSYIPTTVMTGNTTQLTIDLVQLIGAKFSQGEQAQLEAEESMERIGRYVPVIIGFALGGAAAAVLILLSETWWTLVFPLLIVMMLAIAAYVQHHKRLTVS
ncbi:MAG: putative membrane protein [Phormidesmis priestleyi Ana]|uniref:Putative membrane protein n=1 Tax=Phormidesmis priestleyi Ana TaxID=1666911 RepID=A0A0P7YZA9_9CYAN|nr:MAG: putative membrane protein [Phormidesmis priestleyi Ana]